MNSSNRDNVKVPKPRAEATGELIGVRVQPALLSAIDDWRRQQADLPSRPEAIRRIVEQAFDRSKRSK
jgi:hypothetical protein